MARHNKKHIFGADDITPEEFSDAAKKAPKMTPDDVWSDSSSDESSSQKGSPKHGKHARPLDLPDVDTDDESGAFAVLGKHASQNLSEIEPYPDTSTDANSEFEQTFFATNNADNVEDLQAQAKAEKYRKQFKIAGITLLAVLAVAYAVGVAVFFGRFYPNTVAEQLDLSMKTVDEATAVLSKNVENYQVVIDGKDMDMTVLGTDINFSLDSSSVATEMHKKVNPWIWPYEVFQKHDLSDCVNASYDSDKLSEMLSEAIDEHNETAIPSEDAKLGYNEATGKIGVLAEQYGTELVPSVAIDKVLTGVTRANRRVTFDDGDVVPPTKTSDDEGLQKAAENAQNLLSVDLRVYMNSVLAEEINARVYVDWIDVASDYSVSINQTKMNDWINEFVAGVNTKGSTRTYIRPDGKVVTVSGGDYGWVIDQAGLRSAIQEAVANNTVGTYEVTVYESAQTFTGVGEQDWGDRYIDVDITEQHVRFYDSGEIIWESDCITGAGVNTGKSTPEGVYYIKSKGTNVSLYPVENGVKVETPTVVVYWMPFIGNMIGLHDAWWQPYFGGTAYLDGLGSHGCVNLPSDKAAELYGIAQVGDVVITHF